MTGCVGLIILLGIAVFIALLFVRRKKIEGEMTDFYKAHSLYTTTDAPNLVRESLGASENLYSCQANLMTAAGKPFEFYWWEWNTKSTTMVNGVPSVSYSYYLAVSFAPNSVSGDFIEKAIRFVGQTDVAAAQKLKDFFVLNTATPYRAEMLADGTLIICWHVLKRRDVYEAKIAWLKNNVSLPSAPEIIAPEKVQDVIQSEPEFGEITAPEESKITASDESKTTATVFYTHDGYAMLRHKFSSVWANLSLELHHSSAKFQHEGYDELDSDAAFGDPNIPNKIAFTLTDETNARTAGGLFSEHFGGEAYILRDGISIEDRESLGYCNNPFRLPLNKYTYGEFKRRFTERWTNLGIELYNTSPDNGGLWTNNREFTDDFEMTNLKNADRAFLHDYAYISDWGNLLKNVQVAAAIRNDTLNIYCENNLRDLRLRQFNELKNV